MVGLRCWRNQQRLLSASYRTLLLFKSCVQTSITTSRCCKIGIRLVLNLINILLSSLRIGEVVYVCQLQQMFCHQTGFSKGLGRVESLSRKEWWTTSVITSLSSGTIWQHVNRFRRKKLPSHASLTIEFDFTIYF